MKYLSLKVIILALVLPSGLYLASIIGLEHWLGCHYQRQIEKVFIGDTQPLLAGDVALENAIANHIDGYLKSCMYARLGVKLDVSVITNSGYLLYPKPVHDMASHSADADKTDVAADNYRLLNDGLIVRAAAAIPHNVLLSNLLLAFYLFCSAGVVYLHFRTGFRRAQLDEAVKARELSRLQGISDDYAGRLTFLAEEKHLLTEQMQAIQKRLEEEKAKADRNEDQLIQDIVALEEKIKANLALQQEQQKQIEALQEKLSRVEKDRQKPKGAEAAQKRFKALYKNISFHDRAFSGYADLPEEMKIKSEEVISQLNENPSLVKVKRKVFGRKNREPVLEVIFAYRGRLYFSNRDNRIEVLAIGTKNTQARELEFLDRL